MSHQSTPAAQNIHDLLGRWEDMRGSKGGWWALAGFSFQTAVYLERFFRGVSAGGHEPAELAQMERLSDIFVPDERYFRLIQVKRTLERDDLRDALREAYGIASLCDRTLLERIQFQVVYLNRATDKNPADISRTEVKGADDSDLWNRTLAQFDPLEPTFEAPDPLDRLHYLLWECGVRDTKGFLDDCRGKLLGAFQSPTAHDIAALARELASLFHQRANATQDAKRLGRLLDCEVLAENQEAQADHTIVVARRPSNKDLRLGRFRHRGLIFADLVARFDAWWASVVESQPHAEHLPIFWIDGRSGDGKSVLMLQLAQHLLAQAAPSALVGGLSPDQVPDWIASLADAENARRDSPQRPILGLVDDLHAVSDLEDWDQRLQEATQDHVPRAALLACGPTPERGVFERACGTRMKITTFTVPKLDDAEVGETLVWFRTRTGKQPPQGIAGAQNRPLVVLLFELAQGQSLGDFQKTFGKRLNSQGVFDVAREILALNALELPAPTQILDKLSNSQRDFFSRLCDESQFHFEFVAQSTSEPFPGVRLAHPQIGWLLYQEWAPQYAFLAIAWARDVAAVLTHCWTTTSDANFTQTAIRRLGNSDRLAEAHTGSSVGSIQGAIAELHRTCVSDLRLSMLPHWLEYLYRWPDLVLDPDPVQLVFELCSGSPPPSSVSPSVAGWLWRLSETPRFAEQAEEMRRHAWSLISRDPPPPGTGTCLHLIATLVKDRTHAIRLVEDWLAQFGGNIEARRPLTLLVANKRHDNKVLAMGLACAKKYSNAQILELLESMVANWPKDEGVLAEALAWVTTNRKHDKDDRAYNLLAGMVASWPQNAEVLAAAFAWIEAKPDHDKGYVLLASMVKSTPQSDVLAAALAWIGAKPDHEKSYWLLNALVASRAKINKVIDGLAANRSQDAKVLADALADVFAAALVWIEDNPNHDYIYQLLGSMVASWPEADTVWQAARNWWSCNSSHPNAYQLLCTLITRSDGASEWMLVGDAWVTSDAAPGEAQVLAALLSGGKSAPKYLDMVLSRLERIEYAGRDFLLHQLSRSLANNVFASVEYLRTAREIERKGVVAKTLAWGLKRYPNRAEEFIERMDATPVDYQGMLLAGCIRSEMYGAILDCVVEGWLDANRRRRGYGEVLGALRKSPARWKELLERENLSPAVIADFDEGPRLQDGGTTANVPMAKRLGSGKEKRRNERKRERTQAKSSSPPESDLQ
jgi:hypothetical protein